ncbi:oxygen-insensitive NADPH nitroreductase [Tepidibacillus fermentans]|uniref:FMN reductase (NADPH) n=1 Tax=Tepidibacillus fermentans TaxID=1281767 RepID=A0A4R3KI79_9BACI|nr:oxygen-insensitive NADPH nitroreductase [Tepidibacillus fermentans]TCS83207.1 FMN reductase (NADPH) [Tepidibacillus fermentans]
MTTVLDTMRNHRSIRSFQEKPISKEQIERIVSTAQMASTSNFVQAYSIIQVTDQEKRKQLAHFSGDQIYVEQAPVFFVFCADLYRIQQAIHHNGKEAEFSTIENFLVSIIDTALFAQNVMLAAESMGLGGVYIGGIRNQPQQVSEVLQLPQLVMPLFGMCLGYPTEHLPEQKQRLPLSVILHENEYQRDQQNEIEQYDRAITEYYRDRTNGRRADTWSGMMARLFLGPQRKSLRDFIEKQGFPLD